MFIRKLLNGHSKTAREAFYLETGLIPIRFVVVKRRILYLHHILQRSKSEIIRKVYKVQKNLSTKNDWFGVVHENMMDLNIKLSEEEISQMSKFPVFLIRQVVLLCLPPIALHDYCHNVQKMIFR